MVEQLCFCLDEIIAQIQPLRGRPVEVGADVHPPVVGDGDPLGQEFRPPGLAIGLEQRPGQQAGPDANRPAPEQPFGDEQQFKSDDIPF